MAWTGKIIGGVLGSFLGGLGGALVTPVRTIVPGMDTEVIVEAFVVVVIGGLGSFWGTFLGALIYANRNRSKPSVVPNQMFPFLSPIVV